MPLARDAQGGGTEADGRKSSEYCSHCYQRGAFTDPAMTVERMVGRGTARLTSMNLPAGMVAKLAGEIPTLHRWAR